MGVIVHAGHQGLEMPRPDGHDALPKGALETQRSGDVNTGGMILRDDLEAARG